MTIIVGQKWVGVGAPYYIIIKPRGSPPSHEIVIMIGCALHPIPNRFAENNYVVWWVKTQCNPASRFLAMCTLNTINLLEIVYKVYNKLVKKILFIWNTGKATINIRLTRVSVLSVQYLCSAKLMILKSFEFWQFQTHEYR